MSQEEGKQNRVNRIIDDAVKALKAEGVKYFIGVVDRQPKDPDGGKVYSAANITGTEFCYILDVAMPTREDLKNLGIYVGQLILSREQQLKKTKEK